MSTRTEREELSKQMKLKYTEITDARSKTIALESQISGLLKLCKLAKACGKSDRLNLEERTIENLVDALNVLVGRQISLTDEITALDKKLLDQ